MVSGRDAPKVFLPLLRRQRLALERLNVRLLVGVEDLDASDEFLEVVEKVGALVVCGDPNRQREGERRSPGVSI